MKKLSIDQKKYVNGGATEFSESDMLTGCLYSFGAGAIACYILCKPQPEEKIYYYNSSNAPENWEQVLDDNRTLFYEDGFMQGYMAGKSDGLTIAATGRDFW